MVAMTHLRAIADLGNAINLSGVLGRDERKTRKFARQAEELLTYSVPTYPNVEALCTDPTIDWAIVLTPPNARTEIISRLAQSGKSILCEKPIERTFENALAIVEACEQSGVSLGIVFQHRVRQVSIELRKLIDGGTLGGLAIVEVRVPWWREQSYYNEPGRGTYERDGGGVLISQAIHSLDLMLSLTGPVEQVQAIAATTSLHEMESEDFVSAGLQFANGAVGSIMATTASYPGSAESITLHFEKCVAHLESGELILSWRDGKAETIGEAAATGAGADPMAFTHEWHRDIIADFIESYRDKRPPLMPGREGLKVHALIDAIIESSHTKQIASVRKSGAKQ